RPHPRARRLLRGPHARLRRRARAAALLRGGRVHAPRRPGARRVPEGRDLGRVARETRGAGTLRRARRVQDSRARTLSVTIRVAPLVLALCAGTARADDLIGEATLADAAIEERVRLVLVHRLEGDADGLAADVAELAARDAARRDDGLPPTGLT